MGGKGKCQGGQTHGISCRFELPCWVFTISQAIRGDEWDVPGTWRRVAISKVGVCSGNRWSLNLDITFQILLSSYRLCDLGFSLVNWLLSWLYLSVCTGRVDHFIFLFPRLGIMHILGRYYYFLDLIQWDD